MWLIHIDKKQKPIIMSIEISQIVKDVSTEGLKSLLKELPHVAMNTIEGREELEAVMQHNLDDGLIDEIELIIVLDGE